MCSSDLENSDELLEDFLFTFADEPVEVQLALLTAVVKLFVQRPSKGQALVPKVLKWATEETDNPDLRDRGFMYWRLLSSDMQTRDASTAKRIVMGTKPPITTESERLEPVTLEEMCLNIGTLATIYLKPVSQVFRSARPRKLQDSPALQKHQLPTAQEEDSVRRQMQELQLMTAASPGPDGLLAASGGQNGKANGDLSAALDAADAYFTQQNAGYVVNQNQPQTTVYTPDDRNQSNTLLDL